MSQATHDNDLTDDDLEPVTDETAHRAQRVVAAYAQDADEARVLLAMLGIGVPVASA